VSILPRARDDDSDQNHKRHQKPYCQGSGVRWRLTCVVVTVILHESQASARKARACVQATMRCEATAKAAQSCTDA